MSRQMTAVPVAVVEGVEPSVATMGTAVVAGEISTLIRPYFWALTLALRPPARGSSSACYRPRPTPPLRAMAPPAAASDRALGACLRRLHAAQARPPPQ